MEENVESQNPKEHVKSIFKHFDLDRDGHITFAEALSIFKELGEIYEEDDVKNFFDSVDENQDGVITFAELYKWFELDPDREAALRLKTRVLPQEQSKKSQSQTSVPGEAESEIDTHFARISFGDTFEPKTSVSLKLFVGEESDKIFQETSKGLEFRGNYGIVMTIYTKNPAKVEESVKSIITRLLDWAQKELPSYSDLDFKQVKSFTAIEGNTLKIGIETENTTINTLIEEYAKAQSKIIPDGFNGSATLNVDFQRDFYSIFQEECDPSNPNPPKRSILHYLFEGVQATLEAKVANAILKKLRDNYFKSKDFSKLPDRIKNLAFLLLWKGTKIELAFKKFRGSILETMIPKKMDLSIEKLLNDLKEYINPLQRKYLVLKTLLLLINKEFESRFTISVKAPRLLAVVEGKAKGIKEVYEFVSKI